MHGDRPTCTRCGPRARHRIAAPDGRTIRYACGPHVAPMRRELNATSTPLSTVPGPVIAADVARHTPGAA